jgi:hypothetical protein
VLPLGDPCRQRLVVVHQPHPEELAQPAHDAIGAHGSVPPSCADEHAVGDEPQLEPVHVPSSEPERLPCRQRFDVKHHPQPLTDVHPPQADCTAHGSPLLSFGDTTSRAPSVPPESDTIAVPRAQANSIDV